MRETFKSDLPLQHFMHMKLMCLIKKQLQYRLTEEIMQWGFFFVEFMLLSSF